MNFLGLGGFEIMVIGAIALFVLGPKRLLEGIREGRKIYTDLKRQRDALQSLITEAIDLEDLKKQIDADGIRDSVKSLENDLNLDQVAEDVKKTAAIVDKSIPRDWQSTRPPIAVDSEVRNAIPDLGISGGNSGSGGVPKKAASSDQPNSTTDSVTEPKTKTDEVKS